MLQMFVLACLCKHMHLFYRHALWDNLMPDCWTMPELICLSLTQFWRCCGCAIEADTSTLSWRNRIWLCQDMQLGVMIHDLAE